MLLVLPWRPGWKSACALALAAAMNMAVSGHFLLRQDADWKAAVAHLERRIPPGAGLLTLYSSDWASGPVLGYYLKRYLVQKPLEATREGLPSGPWLAVCDGAIDAMCPEAALGRVSHEKQIGRLRLFSGEAL